MLIIYTQMKSNFDSSTREKYDAKGKNLMLKNGEF